MRKVDYKVDWAVLRQASARIDAIAQGAASAMTSMRLDKVATALPGSLSAGRAAALDGQFVDDARALTESVRGHADQLESTAESYAQAEERARQLVEQFYGGL